MKVNEWRSVLNTPNACRVQTLELQESEPNDFLPYVTLENVERQVPRSPSEFTSKRPMVAVGIADSASLGALRAVCSQLLVIEENAESVLEAARAKTVPGDIRIAIRASDNLEDLGLEGFLKLEPEILLRFPNTPEDVWAAKQLQVTIWRAMNRRPISIAVVPGISFVHNNIARYINDAFLRQGHCSTLVDSSPFVRLRVETELDLLSSVGTPDMRDRLESAFAEHVWQSTYYRLLQKRPEVCLLVDSVFDEEHARRVAELARLLRQQDCLVAYWFLDDFRRVSSWNIFLPACDVVFHLQPHSFVPYLGAIPTIQASYVPTACEPEVHKPAFLTVAERDLYECDASFAGKAYPNRVETLTQIHDMNMKFYGPGWTEEGMTEYAHLSPSTFTAQELSKIASGSKVNINLHYRPPSGRLDVPYDTISPRVFEVAACGGFQISDHCIGLEECFNPSWELPTYSSLDSLKDLLKHYLAQPEARYAMAQMARKKALAQHTYDDRAQAMIRIFRRRLP